MEFFNKFTSAIGRLLFLGVLAATFLTGLFGVGYLQLKGEELEIPKVVGMNLNLGKDELASFGLRMKKIASIYSDLPPNTILEQLPRAGSAGKTGLIVSVIVSQSAVDRAEKPADLVNEDEVNADIEELPELQITDSKIPSGIKPKKISKTRDVTAEKETTENQKDTTSNPIESSEKTQKEVDKPTRRNIPPPLSTKPKPAVANKKPSKNNEIKRPRKVPESN